MCGITGIAFADSKRPPEPELLKAMADMVRHRGPDGEGFHLGSGIGLGVRRLGIIDPENGDQPFANEDCSIISVCNGEIYNWIELRETLMSRGHRFRSRSDAEVLVHLYEDHGIAFLEQLRGMFAFALWDSIRSKLYLARDRFGIKPLDFALDATGTIYFGSEMKSILAAARIDRSINPEAVQDLFTFGYVLSPKTLMKNVHKIMPGHYLTFQHGKIKQERYYDYHLKGHDSSRQKMTASEWADGLTDALTESVRLHLRSDVPICAWLSAGIDSSSIAAIAGSLTAKPLQTYSLGFEDPHCDEISKRQTLETFPGYNVENERVIFSHHHFDLLKKSVWHAEEPTPSGVHLALMALARKTSEQFKVALGGEGADEILAGYRWHLLDKVFATITWLPQPLKELLMVCSGISWIKPWFADIFMAPNELDLPKYVRLSGAYGGHFVGKLFSDSLKTDYTPYHPALSEIDRSRWSRIEKMLYVDTRVRMPDFVINGLDRMSMSASVEVRVPFLDHKFVEFCAKMPPSLKWRLGQEKYILRKAMSSILPREIINRRKRGMNAPAGSWLRGHLPPFAEELLGSKALKENGYFNEAAVRDMLHCHREGHGNFARPLMAVLCVQAWDDLFIKRHLP